MELLLDKFFNEATMVVARGIVDELTNIFWLFLNIAEEEASLCKKFVLEWLVVAFGIICLIGVRVVARILTSITAKYFFINIFCCYFSLLLKDED